jgi:hypothetical protein
MNKLVFITLLFLLPTAANSREMPGAGELRITKKAGTEIFYLSYNYKGEDKQVRLYYQFYDSAFVTDGILLKNNDTIAVRDYVVFGDILVFAACDFNFTNKKILFFIDRKKNCNVPVKPGSSYLETGLPAFLITEDRIVAACDQLPFMDSKVEHASVSYYYIGNNAVKWVKQKIVNITEQQAANKDTLQNSKLPGVIFDDTHAKTLEQADRKIAAYKAAIDNLSYYKNPTFFDSIKVYNDRLAGYLLKICSTMGATIDEPFTMAAERNIDIYTSADKKLRCYSWNSRENADALAVFVRNVVQFRAGRGTRSALDRDGNDWVPSGLVDGIRTIHTKDKKTVYLVSANFVDLPEDQHYWLTAVIIEKGHLRQCPIFKHSGKKLAELTYDHAAVPYDDESDKKEPKLHFSKDLQRIYVPVPDEKNKLTGKYIVYKFDGSFFVR